MSLRKRILDLLPLLLVFSIVAAFATIATFEFVVRDPVRLPDDTRPAAPIVGVDPGAFED